CASKTVALEFVDSVMTPEAFGVERASGDLKLEQCVCLLSTPLCATPASRLSMPIMADRARSISGPFTMRVRSALRHAWWRFAIVLPSLFTNKKQIVARWSGSYLCDDI